MRISHFLASASLTNSVAKFVKKLYPNTQITPICFRRLIVTLVNENEIHLPEETTEQFLDRLARLINTSTKIMQHHYNQSLGIQNASQVQSHLENELVIDDVSTTLKNQLSKTLDSIGDSGIFFFFCSISNLK